MPKIKVYNLKGETVEELELGGDIFDVKPKKEVLHQVLTGFLANQRGVYAHTKTRGEVSGGGKKPWKQKGTGRARHGSIRSPIWVGGGVTFGPRKDRNFKVKINKKMKRTALCMLLTDKLAQNGLIIVDKLDIEKPKTKLFFGTIKKLFAKIGRNVEERCLLVADENKNIRLASRNLPAMESIASKDVNFLKVMNNDCLLLEKSAFDALLKRLRKE